MDGRTRCLLEDGCTKPHSGSHTDSSSLPRAKLGVTAWKPDLPSVPAHSQLLWLAATSPCITSSLAPNRWLSPFIMAGSSSSSSPEGRSPMQAAEGGAWGVFSLLHWKTGSWGSELTQAHPARLQAAAAHHRPATSAQLPPDSAFPEGPFVALKVILC